MNKSSKQICSDSNGLRDDLDKTASECLYNFTESLSINTMVNLA